jgi:hypothetical protein
MQTFWPGPTPSFPDFGKVQVRRIQTSTRTFSAEYAIKLVRALDQSVSGFGKDPETPLPEETHFNKCFHKIPPAPLKYSDG